MAKVDEEKVTKLTSELRRALAILRDLQGLSREDFLADEHKKGSAKYHFIVAIEAAVDLCNHLISVLGLRSPESYADTFKVLEEAEAFDKGFASRLVEMAKFRNRLVHFYPPSQKATAFSRGCPSSAVAVILLRRMEMR